jgi:hypothetical protein
LGDGRKQTAGSEFGCVGLDSMLHNEDCGDDEGTCKQHTLYVNCDPHNILVLTEYLFEFPDEFKGEHPAFALDSISYTAQLPSFQIHAGEGIDIKTPLKFTVDYICADVEIAKKFEREFDAYAKAALAAIEHDEHPPYKPRAQMHEFIISPNLVIYEPKKTP